MACKYFTLVVRDTLDRRWAAQCGSYIHSEVTQARSDLCERSVEMADMKIITSTPVQADIDARIKKLNE